MIKDKSNKLKTFHLSFHPPIYITTMENGIREGYEDL